jgi:hypothetical protein
LISFSAAAKSAMNSGELGASLLAGCQTDQTGGGPVARLVDSQNDTNNHLPAGATDSFRQASLAYKDCLSRAQNPSDCETQRRLYVMARDAMSLGNAGTLTTRAQ